MTLHEFHKQIIPLPKQYAVFGAAKSNRGFICETDYPQIWVRSHEYKIYIDTRYLAKMRLYKYLLKKHNVKLPTYGERMGDPEIGVTKPILNF